MAGIDDRINKLTAAVESLVKTVGKKTTGAEASGLTARHRDEDIGQLEAIRDLYKEMRGSAAAAAEARQTEFDIISQKIIATREKKVDTINQGRLDAHESHLKELEDLEKDKEALEDTGRKKYLYVTTNNKKFWTTGELLAMAQDCEKLFQRKDIDIHIEFYGEDTLVSELWKTGGREHHPDYEDTISYNS